MLPASGKRDSAAVRRTGTRSHSRGCTRGPGGSGPWRITSHRCRHGRGSPIGTTGRCESCEGDAPSRAGRSHQLRTAGRTPCVRRRCPQRVRGRVLLRPSSAAHRPSGGGGNARVYEGARSHAYTAARETQISSANLVRLRTRVAPRGRHGEGSRCSSCPAPGYRTWRRGALVSTDTRPVLALHVPFILAASRASTSGTRAKVAV